MILAICLLATMLTLSLKDKELSFDAMMLLGCIAFTEVIIEACILGALMGA